MTDLSFAPKHRASWHIASERVTLLVANTVFWALAIAGVMNLAR